MTVSLLERTDQYLSRERPLLQVAGHQEAPKLSLGLLLASVGSMESDGQSGRQTNP